MNSTAYKAWSPLTKSAIIDIVAPAAASATDTFATIESLKLLLENWQLTPRIPTDLLGPDLLCANTDEKRFQQLRRALYSLDSQAIWCLRGGYGCTRLISKLLPLSPSPKNKLFIGSSDITVLHLFLQQKWRWQTLHGPNAYQVVHHSIDNESVDELKKLIFGQSKELKLPLIPYNKRATTPDFIQSYLTGGTLTLVQASLGTDWQILAKDKILFLEDVNESAYRIDRMLQHLHQSGILQGVNAILFGDFTLLKQKNNNTLIQSVLKRFSQEQPYPVFHCPGIGHDKKNHSLPLGAPAELDQKNNRLTIKTIG